MAIGKAPHRRRWIWIFALLGVGVLLAIYVKPVRIDAQLSALTAAAKDAPTHTVGRGVVLEFVEVSGTVMPRNMRVYQTEAPGRVTAVHIDEGSRVSRGDPLYDFLSSAYGMMGSQSAGMQRATADFDGVVASLDVKAGAFATAGQPIAVLVDDSSFSVRAELDEVDLTRVTAGMPAVITFDSIQGLELPGTVTSVGLVASSRGGVVTLPVQISLDSTDDRLRAGLTAHARITTREHAVRCASPPAPDRLARLPVSHHRRRRRHPHRQTGSRRVRRHVHPGAVGVERRSSHRRRRGRRSGPRPPAYRRRRRVHLQDAASGGGPHDQAERIVKDTTGDISVARVGRSRPGGRQRSIVAIMGPSGSASPRSCTSSDA